MSEEEDRARAAASRCEAICQVVGLGRSTGRAFVAEVLDAFPPAGPGPAAERAWRRRAYLLSQAFHCRLPTPALDDAVRAACAGGGPDAVHEMLVARPEYRSSPQATAALAILSESLPVMDVTYTACLDFTSGIQRVVRSLAHHLPAVAPGAKLVRWDERTSGFVPLDESEARSLACPGPSRPAAAPGPPANRLLRGLARLASWPRRQIERRASRRRDRAILRQLRQPSVFFWGHPLLLPELVGGESHLEALRLLDDATPVRSTLVFYDALPIRRPELFSALAHSMYLRSLGLIRHVGAISCISGTVRADLERLLGVVPRDRPQPEVEVHYLGADFPTRGTAATLEFDRPVVLCVGTIEPRKNQARILRAMVEAQSHGGRFTGVFVGNAGWLNGTFRREFAAAVAAGHSLALHEHLDDDALQALYERAAFTVYGSLDEGFGLPIIESLRRGRPCVTSDRGSMREIAEITGGCKLVDPEDTAAIAAAIGGLVADPQTLDRLTREAAAAAWPSWRDYTETLLRFSLRSGAAAVRRSAA